LPVVCLLRATAVLAAFLFVVAACSGDPAVDVTDSGAVSDGSWWDIATSETASNITPCQFGDRCLKRLMQADGFVSVVSEPAS
jgi:hypothetical protein